MTYETGLLIAITLVAVFLFSFERFPPDVVGVGLLIVLVLTGLLPVNQAFAGFGSDTVVLVGGLLILTAAMEKTGVMEIAARTILRNTGLSVNRLLLVVMLATTGLSAFMSNTAATAFFVPIVLGLAKRAKVSPSRLLMPLAFASILASSLTLISTSTNLVINGLLLQYHMTPLGLFELTPVGLPIAVVGLAYMFTIGRWLVPERQPAEGELGLGHRPYIAEVLVLPDSPIAGKTLEQAALGRDLDLLVMNVVRQKKPLPAHASTVIQAGDALLVEGAKENLLKIRSIPGLQIKSDLMVFHASADDDESTMVEAILLPGHWLVGRTLANVGLRRYHGLKVVGLHRKGRNIASKLGRVALQVGDVLLVQGNKDRIKTMENERAYQVLGTVEEMPLNRRMAALSVVIFAAVLVLGAIKVVSFPIAVLIGAVLVFLTRCLAPEEAYSALNWKAIVLIGSMLGLGVAMEETGTARYLAGLLVQWTSGFSPIWLLAGFFIFTVLLTQPMSNQAAAVVIFPIAFQLATQLELNPRSFAMMIAVAASCSFLTPLEPSCLMVYGPGRYRFMDFVRVGLPLTVAIFLISLWLVPRFWPLKAAL
jgi:di/tricarboxylate transporter